MHLVRRPAWIVAALAVLSFPAVAQTQSAYRQADTRYYLRSEVFAADPAAPVIAPDAAMNMGDSYLITTRGTPPPVVYVQQTHDWIEPITPPSEPASLNIASTAMQIREPLGGVQVALPSAPADFRDVERGMMLPNGSVLRTGEGGSVAVLFGGVDSVRLAPNTQAAVQMNLAGGRRDVEIDVRNGMVFSKVGQRPGEKQAYSVHTPFGDATAHGTDYVTVVYPQRVDVWVAQGTVALNPPNGPAQVTVSTGREPLKVMRYPAPKDAATALAESAESLTTLLNFIPMANQKLAALAARTQSGAHLTPTEKDYISRIRTVVALIKLADVNAPVAAPTPPPRALLVSLPPAVKPAPKPQVIAQAAPPVEAPPAAPAVQPMTDVVLAAKPSPAMAKALAQLAKDSPTGMVKTGATGTASPAPKAPVYQTKTVVIVLPPAHFPRTAPDVDGTTALTDKPAKPKKIAKSVTKPAAKPVTPVVAVNASKPADGEHYLRAQPVNPADLVQAPAVQSAPPLAPPPAAPPEKAHDAAADADPNSLGAPLNPMRNGYPLLPRPPEADATSIATPAVQSVGY
jgi:hypothetical protein